MYLHQPKHATLGQAPEPANPGAGEAQVRVLSAGVCGTDLHAYLGTQPMINYPLIPGHELAVVVEELHSDSGSKGGLRVGDLCSVIPYLSCGTCSACSAGRENACPHLKVLGVHVSGGMTRRLTVPISNLVPANGRDSDLVAIVEMLAVGEHAVARGGVGTDDAVLVVGLGPIGLGAALAARRRGATLAVTDVDPFRVRLAASQGLGTPLTVGTAPSPELNDALAEALGRRAPSVVIDATGSVQAMANSVRLLAPGGRLVLIGHTRYDLTFDNQVVHQRELTVLASRNALRRDFENVLQHLYSEVAIVRSWVTHRAPLDRGPSALAAWSARPDGLIKGIIDIA